MLLNFIVSSGCADAMLNCSQCLAYNICTECDGDLVVNEVGDGCTGKIHYNKVKHYYSSENWDK